MQSGSIGDDCGVFLWPTRLKVALHDDLDDDVLESLHEIKSKIGDCADCEDFDPK
jgi:hypothetical protein